MAWKADGSVVAGFPILSLTPDVECSPALADFDGDGKLEILLPTDNYQFDVVDLPVPFAGDAVQWGMVRHDPQNSGWAVPGPKIGSLAVPAQVKVGQPVRIPLTAADQGGPSSHWQVWNLPDGAHYDANTATVSWQPRVDQAFQKYTLTFVATDGVHQDSGQASVEVLPDAIYAVSMDIDPNWILEDYWSWGVPMARGGTQKVDPDTAHTGTNVLGACAPRQLYEQPLQNLLCYDPADRLLRLQEYPPEFLALVNDRMAQRSRLPASLQRRDDLDRPVDAAGSICLSGHGLAVRLVCGSGPRG